MSNIYLQSGYLDVEAIAHNAPPFNIVIGGRGTGKTYGFLRYFLERRECVIYMRRTGEQTAITATEEFTPYKSVCRDLELSYEINHRGKIKYICVEERDEISAYFLSLSTIANIRGFDASDCTAIIYDEFIPERQARPIKEEGAALLNAYETVNRNRELTGSKPLEMWLLSNSNNLESPILRELGVMSTCLKMERTKKSLYKDPQKGIQIIYMHDSPVSARKNTTALYKVASTGYKSMALENSFLFDDRGIRPRPLAEYIPIAVVRGLCIYRHKTEQVFYVTKHKTGNPRLYTGKSGYLEFVRDNQSFMNAVRYGHVDYERIEDYYEILHLFDP